jgi:hypothetical protein
MTNFDVGEHTTYSEEEPNSLLPEEGGPVHGEAQGGAKS